MTEHKPGRDLDALIAKKVFDWIVFASDAAAWVEGRDWADAGEPLYYPNGVSQQVAPVPHFSTEIAAAWLVVKKMRSIGWHYEVSAHLSNETECAEFARGDYDSYERGHEEEYQVCAATTPHAICLAALVAVKAEKETD